MAAGPHVHDRSALPPRSLLPSVVDMDTRDAHRSDLPLPQAPPPGPDSPSGPRPRLPPWARVLLTTALLLPCAMAGSALLLVPGYSGLLEHPSLSVQVAGFAPFAGVVLAAYVLVAWALLRWVDRRPLSALGLRFDRRAVRGLLAGCGIALMVGLAAGWSTQALGIARPLGAPEQAGPPEESSVLTALALVAFMVLRAFVLQGIGEEVLFRGYLMQSLRRRPVIAVLVAAAAFTIPHLGSSGGQQSSLEHLLYLAIPFGFALSAGFLAVAMRSVWAAIGIHGGFHLATVVAAMLGLMADGPAVWIALGALHAVAGAVVAMLIPRSRWDEVREHGPYARPLAAEGTDRPSR